MRKNWLTKGVVVFLALVLAVPILAGCAPEEEEEIALPAEIVIGQLAALTGPGVSKQGPYYVAMRDYFKWLNEEQGGINGIPIKFLWRDVGYDVPMGIAAYKAFKEQNVVALFCGQMEVMMGLKPFLEQDRITVMSGSSIGDLLWPPGWFYQTMTNSPDGMAMFADWTLREGTWADPNNKRIAVIPGAAVAKLTEA